MKKQLKDHFIPHEGNDYKPNSLQKFSVGVMFVLILLSFSLANIQALLWISSDWLVSTILPSVIVELTNDERTDEALGGLARSAVLDEAARLKAEDMAKYSYFAHHSPQGVSPWYWFDVAGYRYLHAGENLAVHFTDSADVVEGWMNSPTHKANIMNGNYTEIGVGTAKGEYQGYPTVFVVQLFGAPATVPAYPSSVAVAETNTLPTPVVEKETPTVAAASAGDEPAPLDEIEDEPNIEVLEVAEDQTELISSETATETTLYPEASSTPTSTPDVPETPVVVYSDFASTTIEDPVVFGNTGSGTGGSTPQDIGWMGRVATQPSTWLQSFYTALALFVFVSLILSIVIEWRRQHPVQIAYGTGLVAAMAVLAYVHVALTHTVIIF